MPDGRRAWPCSAPPASAARCAPRIVRPASVARADRGHRARRTRGAGTTSSTRATACRWSSRSSTPDAIAERADAALVAYPHGAAAPAVKALRERGLKVVDLSADFRLDRERYERWYQPHEAPELLDEAVYGLPRRTATRSAAPTSWPRPAATPTAALLALLPLREHIADAVVDAKAGVSGAGREATDDDPLRLGRRERATPTRSRATATRAELEQELPGAPLHASCRTCVPIDQGLLASCYVTTASARPQTRCTTLYRDAYADEPFIDLVDEPPGTRDVRDTNRCRIHVTVGRRAGDRVRRDRQPLEGRRRPGGAGPEPDAGPARDGGARVSARHRPSSARAGSSARARDASSSPHALPAGFRAAGVAAGIKPEGLDVGVLVSRRAGHGVRGALHDQRARGRAGDRLARGRARPAARGGRELRLLERRRRRSAGSRPRSRCRRPPPRSWASSRTRWASRRPA